MGMAFRTLAEESLSLSLCNRYESRFSRMYERAYRTLRELQQKTEPKKQKSEPEPPEPPKPNGGIQTAVAAERAQPSEPETKIKKRIQAPPRTVARELLRAVSRLFATPLYTPRSSSKLQPFTQSPFQPFAQFPFRAAMVTERSLLGRTLYFPPIISPCGLP